jgi:hypothetical protein
VNLSVEAICFLHSVSCRTVRVVFTPLKITRTMELKLLFKRQGIELPAKSELVVDLFLTDVEVLHIEEPYFQPPISAKPEDKVQLKCSLGMVSYRLRAWHRAQEGIDSPTFLTA